MVINSARVTFRDSSRSPPELPSRTPRAVTTWDTSPGEGMAPAAKPGRARERERQQASRPVNMRRFIIKHLS